MKNEGSGTKLVVVLVGMAMAAGVASWCYQYETTHQATEFWGEQVAPLIARPSRVEIRQFEPPVVGIEPLWQPEALSEPRDLSKVRGMVHLRHVLFGDKNYHWEKSIDPAEVTWGWRLEFAAGDQSALIVLAHDFRSIGHLDSKAQRVQIASCQPMQATLRKYFADIGLLDANQAASIPE
jgi:hypothetical protein